jgi:pyruvate/2-oxoglutarate dehydrogenase complex dihydrolipoamide acyltransferase (E2) component
MKPVTNYNAYGAIISWGEEGKNKMNVINAIDKKLLYISDDDESVVPFQHDPAPAPAPPVQPAPAPAPPPPPPVQPAPAPAPPPPPPVQPAPKWRTHDASGKLRDPNAFNLKKVERSIIDKSFQPPDGYGGSKRRRRHTKKQSKKRVNKSRKKNRINKMTIKNIKI